MSLTKSFFVFTQRLAGATLLVFANKQDLPGALSAEEIRDVSISNLSKLLLLWCSVSKDVNIVSTWEYWRL